MDSPGGEFNMSGVADPLPSAKGKERSNVNYLCSRPKNGAVGNNRISWRNQMDDITERGSFS